MEDLRPQDSSKTERHALTCVQCGAPLQTVDSCKHCGTKYETVQVIYDFLYDDEISPEIRIKMISPLLGDASAKGWFQGESADTYAEYQDVLLARDLTKSEKNKEKLTAVAIANAKELVDAIKAANNKRQPAPNIESSTQKICSNCGHLNRVAARFCSQCGTSLGV